MIRQSLNNNWREIFCYLIVGLMTTVIGLGFYYLLTYTVLSPIREIELQLANVISWAISVTFAFFANKTFVFKDDGKAKNEIFLFYLGRIGSLVAEIILMHLLAYIVGVDHRLSKIVVAVIVVILNYAISKLFVFRANEKI